MSWMEWIGYGASAFILISMLMTSIVRLRLINLAGCLLFVAYGLLIEAYPVALMNFLIVIVNIYYLVKIQRVKKDDFSILETKPDSDYVKEFLKYYQDDIQQFNPEFDINKPQADECWLLLKDMSIAGIFMTQKQKDKSMKVELDYILKEYRDFRIGTFLYKQNQDFFTKKGVHELLAEPGSKQHNQYLKKMGFMYDGELFRRSIFQKK